MKSIKMRGICAAVTGALLFGFGANAMADSTTDIVNALVAKGVLTEEEGALLNKGREGEAAGQAKALKKAGKVSISDAVDNAKIYGDIRARYERRDGDSSENTNNYETNRSRYKFTLGTETNSGNWYSDIAFAASSSGRSDNVTFGNTAVSNAMGPKDSGAVYLKRLMVGWKPTSWLAVEAGRMKNPLYAVNAMVFDNDIVMEGLQEKFNYKVSDSTELFGTLGQWVYTGAGVQATNDQVTSGQKMVWAMQAGVKQAFMDGKVSGKGAVSLYNYSGNIAAAGKGFNPGLGNTPFTATAGTKAVALDATNAIAAVTGVNSKTGLATYGNLVNDLNILDIPAEVNFMAASNVGVKLYGEYANNLSGNDRYKAACANTGMPNVNNSNTALTDVNVCGLGDDHDAWLLGITVGSAKDLKSFEGKKMAKGDWSANLWYQSVGAYALDPNAVDSDIFDSRVNMEGTSFKAQYNAEDNVALNFTAAHGSRKNNALGAAGAAGDISRNLSGLNLFQFDVTYKF